MHYKLFEDYVAHASEIQMVLKASKERQEKLLEKVKKHDDRERFLDLLMKMPKKWRDKIVMQKVAEGVYRGPFEEVYQALREYGAVPEAMETFWDELGNVPVNDDGILQESFLWWPKGTDREDVWHWFDEKYPGGVAKLMGLTNDNYIHEATEFFNSLAKLADNAKE